MKMLQLNRKFGTSLFTEKQMKSFSIILAFCLCIAGNALSQKKLTEATITYDIVINTHDSNPRAADMLDGATSIIYLKGSPSRSEMKSSLGTQATLIDGKSGNVTMLKNYGEQKYMIKFTPQEWAESNKKYENISFSYVNEFKTLNSFFKKLAWLDHSFKTAKLGATGTTLYSRKSETPAPNDALKQRIGAIIPA